MDSYIEFIESKNRLDTRAGFDPIYMPDWLFDFQKMLVEWSLITGRAAIFADCGMGKTPMQLVWAENVIRETNGKVLILTPLAVSVQTCREADKFGIEAERSRDGSAKSNITVTNYESLHKFDPDDYVGCVLDESSAIKHFNGARQRATTEFVCRMKYRLLCTATAAPNDYIELGTSSEALGWMGRMDMLGQFFKTDEGTLHRGPYFMGGRWKFKAHSETGFWRWVSSWSRAIRKPSDYGFDDGEFLLTDLRIREHVVDCSKPRPGTLLVIPARTLKEQREERRMTIEDRCIEAVRLVDNEHSAVLWCHLNDEGNLLEKLADDCVQVCGSDSVEAKEEKLMAFTDGQVRKLVTKPQIAGFGMNWQHCHQMTMFPSHSFEQYYQAVRRCWRYGQEDLVDVHLVTSPGEAGVHANLKRKSEQADKMFTMLVEHMKDSMKIKRDIYPNQVEVPAWL